ncbi:unnamed protein product [Trichobilharzia regenti]|uniref:MAD2L1-binding protein n=1 Tax=Trichobilharzia regenti TaxID=157069 RepID=A0A183X3L3_TRIRE|nr:unnamed protein product [Trichobilharzia regenti]CAH8840989.1 unnamed protein product [Trichobilharzia regenti]VDQ14844.1 unnamed protein product [Trichobilharzia regenti]
MEICCLPAGVSDFPLEDRCHLFFRIMKLFMYFTGQFPDLSLLIPQNGPKTELHVNNLHPKQQKVLQSLLEIESHLFASKSESILYFLIMMGGLPNNPKHAFLVDLSHFYPLATNVKKTETVIFRELFESLMKIPFFDNLFECFEPTRTYLYICASKDFSSTWFLPRLQFRLPRICPVYVVKVVPDVSQSFAESEVTESSLTHQELHRVLYELPSELRWYASPLVLNGVKPC